jgi:hypothetical protein
MTTLSPAATVGSKRTKLNGFIKTMSNPDWGYGDPPITKKELGYIEKLVERLDMSKIIMGDQYNLFQFLDQIAIPYLNAIREKCKLDGKLITWDRCSIAVQEKLKSVTNEIESYAANALFAPIAIDTNQVSTDLRQSNDTFKMTVGENEQTQLQGLLDNLMPTGSPAPGGFAPTGSPAPGGFESTGSPAPGGGIDINSKIDALINKQKSQQVDPQEALDIESSSALAVGDPNFNDQVDADAPYFETRYKSLTKRTQLIILDLNNTTASPISLTDFACNLQDNLIISRETDVYLEFISLHAIHGNSTAATRLNLELFHCFTLNIKEFNRYYTSYSNLSDLNGQIIIPNDTFGYQDTSEEEIIDSGIVAAADSATTIKFSAESSAVDDTYNNYYVILTGGTGEGQVRTITDYVGSTKVATVGTWATNPDTTTTYNILKEHTSRKVLTSHSVKLKSNFLFTMNPDKIQDLTITFKGLQQGNTVTEDLYLADTNSRVQLGILFKER